MGLSESCNDICFQLCVSLVSTKVEGSKSERKAYDVYLYLEKSTKLNQAFCRLLSQRKAEDLLGRETYFNFAS